VGSREIYLRGAFIKERLFLTADLFGKRRVSAADLL
jgi:hypothetical protein